MNITNFVIIHKAAVCRIVPANYNMYDWGWIKDIASVGDLHSLDALVEQIEFTTNKCLEHGNTAVFEVVNV